MHLRPKPLRQQGSSLPATSAVAKASDAISRDTRPGHARSASLPTRLANLFSFPQRARYRVTLLQFLVARQMAKTSQRRNQSRRNGKRITEDRNILREKD